MTLYVKVATVMTSISNLSISGVTVKDHNSIPSNGILSPKILYPNIENLVSNIDPAIETPGVNGAERITLEYDLGYRYLHCTPQGNVGGVYDVYPGIITAMTTIMVAFLSNSGAISGAVKMRLKSATKPGPVTDPAGNKYWGCDFTLRITEYCEIAP